MSKEIISRGNPFQVEHVDRGFGGARTMVLEVDGDTGDVEIHGVKQNGVVALYSAKKKLSSAEILALDGTPIDVIPAPAAGKWIEIVSVQLFLDYATTAYAGIAATDYFQLKYTDGSGALLTQNVDPTGFADAVADAYLRLGAANTWAPLNAKVVAFLAGPWTTGDSPITLEVLYRIRDLVI